jgi:hypothetical protein
LSRLLTGDGDQNRIEAEPYQQRTIIELKEVSGTGTVVGGGIAPGR